MPKAVTLSSLLPSSYTGTSLDVAKQLADQMRQQGVTADTPTIGQATGQGRLMPQWLTDIVARLQQQPVAQVANAVGQQMDQGFRGQMGQQDFSIGNMLIPKEDQKVAMTVWHGSPHMFAAEEGAPLGRFHLENVGTGEGAQAFGHGAYLTETPELGSYYQQTTSVGKGQASKPFIGGEPVAATNDVERTALMFIKHLDSDVNYTGRAGREYARAMKNFPNLYEPEVLEVIKDWERRGLDLQPGGYLYKVDLPDSAIEKMLDWDAPLSQQPEAVQTALKPIVVQASKSFPALKEADPTGAGIYQAYTQHRGGNQAVASKAIRDAGIPGIKYFDAASRAAKDGSRNYVVFDDSLPKILERK